MRCISRLLMLGLVAVPASGQTAQDIEFPTFSLDEAGQWEVVDYAELLDPHDITVLSQTPSPGTLHTGIPGPQMTLEMDLGNGPETVAFQQELVDDMEPVVEFTLAGNQEQTISPGNVPMYVATESSPLVFAPMVLLASDNTGFVDVYVELNGEPVALSGGSGTWVSDALLITERHNWLRVEAVDQWENGVQHKWYFEVHPKPFYSANIAVVDAIYEETAEGYLVSGLIDVTADQFDVAKVHPDSLTLYFEDEDGDGVDLVRTRSVDCCGDQGNMQVDVIGRGRTDVLTFEFSGELTGLPAAFDLMGVSTWPEDTFLFIGQCPISPRVDRGDALDGGGDAVNGPPDGDPQIGIGGGQGGGDEGPPDVQCEVWSWIAKGRGWDHEFETGSCGVGVFRKYHEVDIRGGTIQFANANAELDCWAYPEVNTIGSASETGEIQVRTVPSGCAAGAITVFYQPSLEIYCEHLEGGAGAEGSITVVPPSSTSDPSVGFASVAGGVSCDPNHAIGSIGVTVGPLGVSIPVLFTDPKKLRVPFSAQSIVHYEYLCRDFIIVPVTAVVAVQAIADREFWSWTIGPAFGDSGIHSSSVNTRVSWDLIDCDSGESHTGQIWWD